MRQSMTLPQEYLTIYRLELVNMEKSNIILYAPLGRGIPLSLTGGGEAGCRRTYEVLTGLGYRVYVIEKAVAGRGAFGYIGGAIKGYLRLIILLIRHKDAILYIAGFYERNIYLERLFEITGRTLKRKIIYEARNGRLVSAYQEGSRLYKRLMKTVISDAALIFCQGSEYLSFVEGLSGAGKALYTPNYVLNRYLKEYAERSMGRMNIVYFGRIAKSKNIKVIIEAYAVLAGRQIDCSLTLIGFYEDSYRKELDAIIRDLGLEDKGINFTGGMSFDELSKRLSEFHYFIFPSNEKKEGHSNSLTEAMAYGIVPVASSAGFNERIIDAPELIVRDHDPVKYADIMQHIWETGAWSCYSHRVYDRVRRNYSETIVRDTIKGALENI